MFFFKVCSVLFHRSSRITDEGIVAIALGCPSLKAVNMAYNSNITDSSLAFLSKCQKLRTLEIRGCPHISPQGLSNIVVGCKNLETMDLKKCRKINDTGIIQLAQHSQSLKQVGYYSLLVKYIWRFFCMLVFMKLLSLPPDGLWFQIPHCVFKN